MVKKRGQESGLTSGVSQFDAEGSGAIWMSCLGRSFSLVERIIVIFGYFRTTFITTSIVIVLLWRVAPGDWY
jgi:hypothetical protein